MGVSNFNLMALRVFAPNSVLGKTLEFFEFLMYETKAFRDEEIVSKDDLLDAMSKSIKIKQAAKAKKSDISKQFEEFAKDLDRTLWSSQATEDTEVDRGR